MQFNYKERYGQNFISDGNFLESLVRAAGIEKGDEVLEIGAGGGGLTLALSRAAGKVVAYEIDTELKPVLEKVIEDSAEKNITVIFADALKESDEAVAAHFSGDFKIVANLPYYITTPLIFKFLDAAFMEEGNSTQADVQIGNLQNNNPQSDNLKSGKIFQNECLRGDSPQKAVPRCKSMALMVQKEVADRLNARAGTEEYGSLTVAAQARCDVKLLKNVPRRMFYPVPDVDSAFIELKISREKFAVKSAETFDKLLRCVFTARRKTLTNNLVAGFGLSRECAEEILQRFDLDLKTRGESLTPENFIKLSDLVYGFLCK